MYNLQLYGHSEAFCTFNAFSTLLHAALMDPGSALGIVSLTLQVFAGCVKGYFAREKALVKLTSF